LCSKIEALQTQLKEQTRLAKEQIEGLLEDRRIRIEESDARRLRDQDKIKMLTEKLVLEIFTSTFQLGIELACVVVTVELG
jgi:uncharacterized protein YaiL (DUF2058 family)